MIASCLNGKKFRKIICNDDNEVLFYGDGDEPEFKMFHYQDCCECVSITGATIDGIPVDDFPPKNGLSTIFVEENGFVEIVSATESEPNLPAMDAYDESFLWTIYEIVTSNGTLAITWYGTSNGYYGESPTIAKMTENGWTTWE